MFSDPDPAAGVHEAFQGAVFTEVVVSPRGFALRRANGAAASALHRAGTLPKWHGLGQSSLILSPAKSL
jgi:hypothetical protein